MSRLVIAVVAVLVGLGAPEAALAQAPAPDSAGARGFRTFTISAGHVAASGEGLGIGVVGFQITHFPKKGTGGEFALYTAPTTLKDGTLVLVPKVSAVHAARMGEGWGLLKVGGEVIMATQGGGGLLGLHAGFGVILPLNDQYGIRLEAEPHIAVWAPTHPVFMVTLGLTALPRQTAGSAGDARVRR